jgi:hypothetical protein
MDERLDVISALQEKRMTLPLGSIWVETGARREEEGDIEAAVAAAIATIDVTTAAVVVVTIAEMTAVDMNDVTGTNDAVTGMSRTDATTAVNAEDLVVTHRDVNKLSSTWNLYKKINIFDKNIFSSCCREFKSYNFRVSIFFSLKQKYNSQT